MSMVTKRRCILVTLILAMCFTLLSFSAAAKTKITFATGYAGNGLQTILDRIKEFERQNSDIEVEVVQFASWADIRAKLLTMVVAGNAPDVVHTTVTDAPEFLDNGILLDITKYAPEINKANYFFSDVYNRNGKQFGGYESHVQVHVVYYNEDMFALAGIPTPNQYNASGKWNWDTFMSVAKKLTNIDSDGKVTRFGARVPVSWAPSGWGAFRLGAGARIFSPDFKQATIDTPEMRNALTYFNSLLENHVIPRPGEGLGSGDALTNGKIAMDFVGTPRLQFYTDSATNLNWDIAPPPAGPQASTTYRTPGADGLVVSTTKHPDEAWRLAKFFLSEYVQNDKARTRLEVPVMKKALVSSAYLQAPPKNMRVVADVLNRSVSQPVCRGCTAVTTAVDKALAPVFRGEASLEAGISEAQRLAQTTLDDARKK